MAWLFGKKKNQNEESNAVVETNVEVKDTKDLNLH